MPGKGKKAKPPRGAARRQQWQFRLRAGDKVIGMAEGAKLEYHDLCLAFPKMPDDEFRAHCEDIKLRGVREEGWLFEGKILEGRHRFMAALATGQAMTFREYKGDDPIGFVISANMRRRHLDPGARAMALVNLEKYQHGGARRGALKKILTRQELADLADVSKRTMTDAAAVRDKGAPALRDAAARSAVPVSVAATVARGSTEEEQTDLVARGEKEIIKAAKDIRAKKNEDRRIKKIARTIEINKGNKPLAFGGEDGKKVVVLSADPPWRYERPLIGDCDKSIEEKYPTMPLTDILAMPVHKFMAPAAAIGLHIPQPLAECEMNDAGLTYPHAVGRAWGDPHWDNPKKCNPKLWFRVRTVFIWEKRSPEDIARAGGPLGMGHYGRTDHECFYIMTRGGLALPAFKPRSVFHIRSRGKLEHSEKPAEIYDAFRKMYQEYCDAGLAVALFERQVRPGFIVWGNQAPAVAA